MKGETAGKVCMLSFVNLYARITRTDGKKNVFELVHGSCSTEPQFDKGRLTKLVYFTLHCMCVWTVYVGEWSARDDDDDDSRHKKALPHRTRRKYKNRLEPNGERIEND